MAKISTKELFELYLDTLQLGSNKTFNEYHSNKEMLESIIFEDFDIGVHSFLHEKALNTLQKASLIDSQIKECSLKLRDLSEFIQLQLSKRKK